MRKALAMILAIMICIGFTGCGTVDSSAEAISGEIGYTVLDATVKNETSDPAEADLVPGEPAEENEPIQEEPAQEETTGSGLPYFEISFSADDFLFAGYKVTDGIAPEDIMQIVSQELPPTPNGVRYTGWSYLPEISEYPRMFSVIYSSTENATAFGKIYYSIEDLSWAYDTPYYEVSIGMSLQDARFPANEAPVISSPIVCGMSYDEVIAILALSDFVTSYQNGELTEKDPATINNYFFESQHGKSGGCCVDTGEAVIVMVDMPTEKLRLDFKNDVLVSFSYTGIYQNEL